MTDHVRLAHQWLLTHFKTHARIRKLEPRGTESQEVIERQVSACDQDTFLNYLAQLHAPIDDVIKVCEEAGWIEKLMRLGSDGKRLFYWITPRVLEKPVTPSEAAPRQARPVLPEPVANNPRPLRLDSLEERTLRWLADKLTQGERIVWTDEIMRFLAEAGGEGQLPRVSAVLESLGAVQPV